MLQPFTLQEVFALVRFERWDEVLVQPAPPAGRDLQDALYHFTRGAAHAGKGQAAEAIKAQAAFEAVLMPVSPETQPRRRHLPADEGCRETTPTPRPAR